jgi:hypothetical protein
MFKGNNRIIFNKQTMEKIVELYINSQLKSGAPYVRVTDVHGRYDSGEEYTITVVTP